MSGWRSSGLTGVSEMVSTRWSGRVSCGPARPAWPIPPEWQAGDRALCRGGVGPAGGGELDDLVGGDAGLDEGVGGDGVLDVSARLGGGEDRATDAGHLRTGHEERALGEVLVQ